MFELRLVFYFRYLATIQAHFESSNLSACSLLINHRLYRYLGLSNMHFSTVYLPTFDNSICSRRKLTILLSLNCIPLHSKVKLQHASLISEYVFSQYAGIDE